jgi:hypothetical protein
MKCLLSIISVLIWQTSVMAHSFTLVSPDATIKILKAGKRTLLINEHNIYTIQKNGLARLLALGTAITDATIHENDLIIATNTGLKVYDVTDFKEKKNSFPKEKISAIGVDVLNRLWIATTTKGCYMQTADNDFELKLNIAGMYALKCSADSNIWIGTNIGMYRIAAKNFETTRYAEEGYSGYELPDNIVEQIFTDQASNVWVVMPDNVSFKRNNDYTGEIPSYDFVGVKNNEVRTIVALSKSSYIFITAKGCYLLPSSSLKEEHHHNNEIFAENNTHAFELNNKQLKCPQNLETEPIIFAEKVAQLIYFITAKGGWSVSEKNLF